MLPLLLSTFLQALKGPLREILDKAIPDADLKARLEADIAARLIAEAQALMAARGAVLEAEITRGSWLARNWRPILMLFIMFVLAVFGLLLPLADIAAGKRIPFSPRWADIPDKLWDLLAISIGGYIGGRSVEKIVSNLPKIRPGKP
jgi:hypothetical protein